MSNIKLYSAVTVTLLLGCARESGHNASSVTAATDDAAAAPPGATRIVNNVRVLVKASDQWGHVLMGTQHVVDGSPLTTCSQADIHGDNCSKFPTRHGVSAGFRYGIQCDLQADGTWSASIASDGNSFFREQPESLEGNPYNEHSHGLLPSAAYCLSFEKDAQGNLKGASNCRMTTVSAMRILDDPAYHVVAGDVTSLVAAGYFADHTNNTNDQISIALGFSIEFKGFGGALFIEKNVVGGQVKKVRNVGLSFRCGKNGDKVTVVAQNAGASGSQGSAADVTTSTVKWVLPADQGSHQRRVSPLIGSPDPQPPPDLWDLDTVEVLSAVDAPTLQ
jgi:hypothetical protein